MTTHDLLVPTAPPALRRKEELTALVLGALILVATWGLRSAPAFAAAWLGFLGWILWRSRHGQRTPWLGLAAYSVGLVPILWPGAPAVVLVASLALATGVIPAHLGLEDFRRSLARSEYALLIVLQPGVALLHAFLVMHPDAIAHHHDVLLRGLFVATAIAHSGLALVRREPERAIAAVASSQAALTLAGALDAEHGWASARMMLASLSLASAVLLSILIEVRRRHGVAELSHRHGLASLSPDLHRVFVACGWIFVGLPGGATFFAEDLLFHSLVHDAPLTTCGFVLAAGTNAIAFYRVYLGVFTGTRRAGPVQHASSIEPSRPAPAPWFLPVLVGLTLAQYILGFLPNLLI
jgi:NADH:ubiquinone oxidoreductase subunit 4 (subunit M)